MKNSSGIGNSVVVDMALAAVAVCLLAGVLAGCGEDEPSGSGSAAIDQSSPNAEVNQGINGPVQGPDQAPAEGQDQAPAGQDRSANRNGPGAEPTPRPGSGKIPPGLAETRLTGVGAGLPGRIGMMVSAPGGPGPQVLVGELTTGPAWSTINLPVAERVLEDGNGPSGIGKQARDQIKAAVSRSDTEAALALFSRLKSAHGGPAGAWEAVRQTMRVAGGRPGAISILGRDAISGPGHVEWPLGAQNQYMAALAGGCKGDAAARKFLLAQMAPADGRESYGLGSIGPSVRWISSSGLGPNGNYLARQMGVFYSGGGPVIVAMMALPFDGSPETGKAMLNEITDRLVSRLANQALPKRPCSGTGSPAG